MFNKAKVKSIIDRSTDLSAGTYNGKVVSTADPDRANRVKVQIPELTEGISIDHLPWYSCKQPFNKSPNSQASTPPLGSEVVVEFPDNDIYNGLVGYVIVSVPPT